MLASAPVWRRRLCIGAAGFLFELSADIAVMPMAMGPVPVWHSASWPVGIWTAVVRITIVRSAVVIRCSQGTQRPER